MTKTSLAQGVIVGVDTHKDIHVAVAIDPRGRHLGTTTVPTTEVGCGELYRWALSFGQTACYGVEGTGSYGAGLSRYLRAQGSSVLEIRGPNRKLRHDRGKSDPIDAEAAARAVLAGTSTIAPKHGDAWVEQLRILRVSRRSAIRARTQALNQIHAVVVGAPQELRDALSGLPRHDLLRRAARFRVSCASDPASTVRWTLRLLALRCQALTDEVEAIDQAIQPLLEAHAMSLLEVPGVGPEVAGALIVTAGDNPERLHSEASFAALCGVNPLPASSGKTQRHRLNRGGDREANCALYRVAMSRLTFDPRTQAYARRRTAEGMSKKEIIRCLKRYIARELFCLLPAIATR
jgi:transposase